MLDAAASIMQRAKEMAKTAHERMSSIVDKAEPDQEERIAEAVTRSEAEAAAIKAAQTDLPEWEVPEVPEVPDVSDILQSIVNRAEAVRDACQDPGVTVKSLQLGFDQQVEAGKRLQRRQQRRQQELQRIKIAQQQGVEATEEQQKESLQRKEFLDVEIEFQRLIGMLLNEAKELFDQRVLDERRRQANNRSEAMQNAGKDAFAGLMNKRSETPVQWYLRAFRRIIALPVAVSIPLQAVIWFCLGFIFIPAAYLAGRFHSCPNCGMLWARKVADREVLAQADAVATVTQRDEHYGSKGHHTGHTNRQQQVAVRRELQRLHYVCKHCLHEWNESQLTQNQI